MNVAVKQIPANHGDNVVKLSEMLTKYGSQQEQNTFKLILNQMQQMDKTCESLLGEVAEMKSQLQAIQDKSVGAKLSAVIDKISFKVTEIKSDITEIKNRFSEAVSHTLSAVKEKGISALHKTAEFLKLKPLFSAVKTKLQNAAKSLLMIDRNIENYRETMHRTKAEKTNARRQLLGLPIKEYQPKKSKGPLFPLQHLVKKIAAGFQSMAKSAEALETGIDRLQGKKHSVRSELKDSQSKTTLKIRLPAKANPSRNDAR